jgi:hypothetical protein
MAHQTDENFLPPPKKNSWIIIYTLIGSLVVIAFILIAFFRERSPEPVSVKKSKIPPLKSAYALVMSPLDSSQAAVITQDIKNRIGADSSRTKMVVGSTTIYDQCISVADYQNSILKGLKSSKEIDLKTQALLFSQLTGIMISDTLPAQLYLIGRIGNDTKDSVPARLLGTIRDLDLRSKKIGKVDVVSYLTPPDDPKVRRVLSYFTERGFAIIPGNF